MKYLKDVDMTLECSGLHVRLTSESFRSGIWFKNLSNHTCGAALGPPLQREQQLSLLKCHRNIIYN